MSKLRNFKNEVVAMKTLFPDLNEEGVKGFLLSGELRNKEKYTVERSVELLKSFNNSRLRNEVDFLLNCIEEEREKCTSEEVETAYKDYKRGEMNSDEFVFMRDFLPMNEKDFFTLKWSLKKVNNIIKENSLKKDHFNISKMNIDRSEIDEEHLSVALHNKKPAIVGTYRPLKPIDGDNQFYTVLDGNHRIVAKERSKGATEYPVYLLNDIETYKGLSHPFYAAYYLIHLLIALFWNYQYQSNAKFEENFQYYLEYKQVYF